MKKYIKSLLISASLVCGTFLTLSAQRTLHLRANSSAYLDNYNPTVNQGTAQEMDAIAWTAGGTPFVSRCVFNFDLSAIPAHSIITSAKLSLWGDTNTGNTEGDDPLSGSNAWYIQRVTSPWSQYVVDWNTQPTTTVTNEVSMPQSTSIYEIFNGIDVTTLMQDILTSGNNYGLLIRLQTESVYRSMVFCSSQYPDTNEIPLLVITYKSTTGITEVSNSPMVSLYPNPVKNNMTITYSSKNSEAVYYSIYDLTGKQIITNTVLGAGNNISGTINTEGLSMGMYFIKLIDGNTVTNSKFIKE